MDAVARFTELVGTPDPPLDRAALLVAAGADPLLDAGRWLEVLDELAVGVSSLADLRHRLFVAEGFTGNTAEYGDPRNSLLPHVLTRKLGIPITLAVVTMEVGRRAGIPVHGVGMPGHFLVRAEDGDTWLDVFAGGAELDLVAVEAKFTAVTGGLAPFDPAMLAPTPVPMILARMLENLRGCYQQRRRFADVEWVLRMRLALPGAGLAHTVALADALGEQARWDEGAHLLDERAAALVPAQATQLRLRARALLANLN